MLISVDIDGESDVKGYLAIDASVNGRSYGGLRMSPDLSPEMTAQVARMKTLKYGFTGLPVGGANAGIVGDPEMPQKNKREILRRFGQAVRLFLRTKSYIPAEDFGTSADDIRFMLTSVGLKVPPRSLTWHLSSGFYTGITVFAAAVAVARHIDLDLKQASVAIEGFGNVGASAARMFWERGMRVVAISTSRGAVYNKAGLNIDELIKLRARVGSQLVNFFSNGEKIDKSRLAGLDVDIFSPCAHSYSITADNAGQVIARIVSPGANAPTTAEVEPLLLQRGVFVIPDFMANCGGVLGIAMRRTGLKEAYIRHFLEGKIGGQIAGVTEAADKERIALRTYAERVAEGRFLRAKASAEKRNITTRAFNFALELYRKGAVPYQLVTPFASRYFEGRLRIARQ